MWKLTDKLIFLLLLAGFFFFSEVPAKAETTLEEIQRTGILKVGIRTDAIPFGYRKPNGELTGYCLGFFAVLKERVSAVTGRKALLIRISQSTASDRFDLVEDRAIHIECGPNTIRDELPNEGVIFSQPFFQTGTQFLILESNRDRVNLNSSLAGARIAVLRGTTTETLVLDRYPQATLVPLQGSTARRRGAQGVLQGRFDTFVSDGILLLGEAEALNLSTDNYALIPEVPLSCDRYGMILPEDEQWQNLINSILSSEQGREIWTDWFEVVLPKIKKTMETCESGSTVLNQIPD
ncbi:MAG: transporter substrate-binding domain-containing protein [Cyanobacteria bacterium]|jgi:polar amino acid transport system substrate-binding protein|nr:transporter substrate-binding domain-containing protein [Cyanobacteria bacterium GSL.Bin1]